MNPACFAAPKQVKPFRSRLSLHGVVFGCHFLIGGASLKLVIEIIDGAAKVSQACLEPLGGHVLNVVRRAQSGNCLALLCRLEAAREEVPVQLLAPQLPSWRQIQLLRCYLRAGEGTRVQHLCRAHTVSVERPTLRDLSLVVLRGKPLLLRWGRHEALTRHLDRGGAPLKHCQARHRHLLLRQAICLGLQRLLDATDTEK